MCICYSEDSGSPKKPLSIPRLELQAAGLSARLAAVVIKDCITDSTYYWTGSSTVFQWIHGVSKRHLPLLLIELGRSWSAWNPTKGTTGLDS